MINKGNYISVRNENGFENFENTAMIPVFAWVFLVIVFFLV